MSRFRWVIVALYVLGSGSSSAAAEAVDETTIRQAILSLDELNPQEREQWLPWLMDAIDQLPDVHRAGELSQALSKELADVAAQAEGSVANEQGPWPLEESLEAAREQERFEAFLKEQEKPLPSEEGFRRQIEALALDPEKPEIALNKALELGELIARIEDHGLQEGLRRSLEDRLAALQANL